LIFFSSRCCLTPLLLRRFLASFSSPQITTPEIVRETMLLGTGFNPRPRQPSRNESGSILEKEDDNQIYQILGTNMALIGTSEIPLVAMNADNIVSSDKVNSVEIQTK
jgi:seryl-tRNA synthetase